MTGLMPDGYHQVKTLMQTISLADTLSFDIQPAREPSITITAESDNLGGTEDFPLGADNLIAKAIRLYLSAASEYVRSPLKISVHTKKQIPIGAGMAGGSGNGAAALLAMNNYFLDVANRGVLSQDELIDIGKKLGADVPFSLTGGTAVGTGRGDELTAVETALAAAPLHFLLAKPRHLHVSTPWAYKTYDELGYKFGLSERLHDRGIADDATKHVADNLKDSSSYPEAYKAFGNDFEQALFPHYKELKELKTKFMELGALACHMTGSGPTIYAVCDSAESAETLKQDYKEMVLKERDMVCATKFDPVDLFVVHSITHGAKVIDG
ncbi:MAG: 4-diphosphocytidyl-2-C-methyl-D-erythritol kinase [Cyanobacteriota bacterium erpe_2018_sw_39hr_WHONDRS-SW48-000098_B_bin.30]|nr:4-diphosphocytidyl-2-C-methyl-D-erythritol kinase [Cyanobacteriota bacterium erpe_2018_sw_39hr_WHONDRS-SW48-000098_B_bin.30]